MGIFLESNIGKVSGQVVYLASGFNTVNAVVSLSGVTSSISGQTPWIADTSGGGIQTFAIGGERFLRVSISGQPVTVDVNVAANVSGNIVYLTSGQNNVQVTNTVTVQGSVGTNVSGNTLRAQFFDPSGNTWRDPWFERSGGHKLQTTASGDAYTISNTVTIAGAVTTSVSGNNVVVLQSGGSASGQQVLTSISGNNVYLTSGNNAVQNSGQKIRLQGFDPSGNEWRDLFVHQSGGNKLAVDAQISADITTNISGNVVYLTSGQNGVQLQAFDPSGSTMRQLWVERSGGNRLLATVSGDTVNIPSNNTIDDAEDDSVQLTTQSQLMGYDNSGAVWRRIRTSQSGSTDPVWRLLVGISGQPVSISGAVVNTSGQPANISGNTIRAQAFDPSGNSWRDLWVSQSGGNSLLVSAAITTNISGNVIYLTSGQNSVQTSGQMQRMQAFDPSGATWRDLWVNQSGGNRLLVTWQSGETVTTSISGNYVSTSGSAVVISGQRVRVSGDAVVISGQTIVGEVKVQDFAEGALTNVKEYRSGSKGMLVGTFVPQRLKAYPILYASAASGGTALDSGICARVTLRNVSQTSGQTVFVGFSGTNNSPFASTSTSGRGFYLRDGDGVTIETDNPAMVRVVSITSGTPISYFAIGDI